MPREILGGTLGPAKGEGDEMAQWCLKANGNVVPRRTVRPLNAAELNSETEIREREVFTDLIKSRWGLSPTMAEPSDGYEFDEYEDDNESPLIPDFNDPVDATRLPAGVRPPGHH
jgi:hypothetical protein